MEPAEPLPVKLALDDFEVKDETVLLTHHSMLTPSDIKFSVLRNPHQNFKYRGVLWLTDKKLIYKGFPVVKMGVSRVSEKLMRPFCEVDIGHPYKTIISTSDISDVFIGHDNTFQKRFQRYPKLRVTYKSDNGESTSYFYLTRENLIDDELYINKRCSEWHNRIKELIDKATGVTPTAPAVPAAPAVPPAPKPAIIGTETLLKKAEEEVGARRFGKVTVKPLEEREKPDIKATATIIKPEAEEEEPAFTKLLDALVPVSDEEFTSAAADSSIAKCPYCGWILGYSTSKCPRCRKVI